jgi:hypothetical protein
MLSQETNRAEYSGDPITLLKAFTKDGYRGKKFVTSDD